jgi:hypothetical protein
MREHARDDRELSGSPARTMASGAQREMPARTREQVGWDSSVVPDGVAAAPAHVARLKHEPHQGSTPMARAEIRFAVASAPGRK